jgi:hypothetical protein
MLGSQAFPNEELENLSAKMHVSRGGQLTPYGDPLGVLAETKAGLDQFVSYRAYYLWERAMRTSTGFEFAPLRRTE